MLSDRKKYNVSDTKQSVMCGCIKVWEDSNRAAADSLSVVCEYGVKIWGFINKLLDIHLGLKQLIDK